MVHIGWIRFRQNRIVVSDNGVDPALSVMSVQCHPPRCNMPMWILRFHESHCDKLIRVITVIISLLPLPFAGHKFILFKNP